MQHGFRKESELREREIENSGKDLKESGETVPKGWINRTNSLDTFWSVCFVCWTAAFLADIETI